MLENDDRKEHKGFKIGQVVHFRYAGSRYRGKIVRLTQSKVSIKFYNTPHIDVQHVSYRQIESVNDKKEDTD